MNAHEKALREALDAILGNGGGVAEAIRAYLAAMDEAGWRLVPKVATRGLLVSMALRNDHALAAPDMGAFEYRKPSIQEWQEGRLREMAKLHEEVVGTGFYSPEKEADYTAMLTVAPKPEHAE